MTQLKFWHHSGCVSCSVLHPAKLNKLFWSLQQHCSWSSGRDTELPMCANGRCLTGVRRRYDRLDTSSVIIRNHGSDFFLMFNCRRNWSWKLWTMPTVSQRDISTPTCAALWFWSVSQLWWVLSMHCSVFYLQSVWSSEGSTSGMRSGRC